MTNFENWEKQFRMQNLFAFNHNPNGLLWLKVRSVCRHRQLGEFISENNIQLNSSKIKEQNVELFDLLEKHPNASRLLDDYLRVKNHEWYNALQIDEDKLKDDLYKVRYYKWGGDQNNSLDKYLVSRFVKVISDYESLVSRKSEIADNSWNYVQNSWYNNWTSYLIEAIFKRHERVISAVGEIKGVDFFIDSFPIDLKVTFFPKQYMDEKIKAHLGFREVVWLKRYAKKYGISVDPSLTEEQQKYVLTEKLSDEGHVSIVEQLTRLRKEIITDAKEDKREIITWLYSHQGEMRFGAENRLYIILADATDIQQSWKMKRAFSLIEPTINNYLDTFNNNSLHEVKFVFNKNNYRSLADALFIIKEK